MDIEYFPHCCGIMVLGDFYANYDGSSITERVANIRSELRDTREAVFATISEHQVKDWKVPLTRCGFTQIKRFKNPNSGNTIYVYWKNPKRAR